MMGLDLQTTPYGPSQLKQSLLCVFLSAPTPPSTDFIPSLSSLFSLAYKI